MNKQRTVIYEKRRHALMGERIGMDITNTIWDRVLSILDNNDYNGCKEQFLKLFFMEPPFTEEEFLSVDRNQLEEISFQKVMENFKAHVDKIAEEAAPVVKQIYEDPNVNFERILIPLTDQHMIYRMSFDLKECYDTEAKNIMREFEKMIILHNIDDNWKENLRQLDELRHSSQNASYEQKDPLLIFKLESVKIWDNMINGMNNRIVSILMRGAIPEMAPEQEVREAAPEQHSQRYTEQKEDLVDQNQQAAARHDTREGAQQINRTPIVKEKLPGRNDPCPCGSGKKFKNCHGRGIV